MSSSTSRELEAVRLRAEALEERYRKAQQEVADSEHHLGVLRGELAAARDRIETLLKGPDLMRMAQLEQALAVSGAASAELADTLRRDLDETRAAALAKTTELSARVVELETRATTAERELAESRKGTHRLEADLELARGEAAKVPQLEAKLADHQILSKLSDQEYATVREQVAELQARLRDPEVANARERADALAAEVKRLTEQLAAEHSRANELERRVAGARDVAEVDAAIADAAKARRTAAEHAETLRAAERRALEAEGKMAAAETLSKTLSKDVTEMLKRVREVEAKLRQTTAERDEARAALAATADQSNAIAELERRANEAEDRAQKLEQAFGGDLEGLKTQLEAKRAAIERELTAKLANVERELAAERTTAARLVERKNRLERELTEVRKQLEDNAQRIDPAELERERDAHVAELERARREAALVTDRLRDSQAAELERARREATTATDQLRESQAAELERARREAATAAEQLRESQADVAALERRVHALEDGIGVAEPAALAAARAEVDRAKEEAAEHRRELEAVRAQLDVRAVSKRRIDAVERDRKSLENQLADAERRARGAEEAERERRAAEGRVADLEKRARLAERDVTTLRSQVAAVTQRETAAEARVELAERSIVELRRKIVEGQEQISQLQRELATTERARLLASDNDEREIKRLQDELRSVRAAFSQGERTRHRREFTESETTVERGAIRYRNDDD